MCAAKHVERQNEAVVLEDDRLAGLKHVCRVWAAGQWSDNKQNLIVCRKNGRQWRRDEGGRGSHRGCLNLSQSLENILARSSQFPEIYENQSQQC